MRIAVVGAGPAGTMAAIRLARAGAAVTLFDSSHPREKPCGGGLTRRAVALVADVVNLAALAGVAVARARVETAASSTGTIVDSTAPLGATDPALLILSRRAFDGALLDAAVAAGARLVRERVLDVAATGSASAVTTALGVHRADALLGADGANSLVRRRLSARFSRDQLSIGAGFFAPARTSREITIRCLTAQPGYLWSFPRTDHLAVGICAPASGAASSADLSAQTRAWIDATGLARGRLDPYSWPIPTLRSRDFRRNRIAGPSWLLLGDAAGLVDPLTREGIYYALLSGVWAAEALLTGRRHCARDYETRVSDEVYPELRRASSLTDGFFRAEFSSLLVEALESSAPIRQVFRDLVTGSQPYRGLRRRLLRTREWGIAARALSVSLRPAKTIASSPSNGGAIQAGFR